MSTKLENLYREGKITAQEYETYLLFATSELGIRYLKRTVDASFMEEPINPRKTLFQWHDGRRSVWRDIKNIIYKVESLLKGEKKK